MKIIFAQGNPGLEYAGTRHNVGFMALDHFAGGREVGFKGSSKFMAEIAELTEDGEKILLVKPTTFYNETGRAARALVDFYKLNPAEDLLVIHDDLALPFGHVRTRLSGSDAGNNGIKSLNAALGQDYARIRIGIYNDLRDRINDADFVLSRFTKDEMEALNSTITLKVSELIEAFMSGDFEVTSHKLHTD